jgi:hypothetical protein
MLLDENEYVVFKCDQSSVGPSIPQFDIRNAASRMPVIVLFDSENQRNNVPQSARPLLVLLRIPGDASNLVFYFSI